MQQIHTVDVQTLTINEDNLFRWDKARKASDGTYINSGSGTWTVIADDDDDTEIATGSMTYVTASNGRWHGTLDKADAANLIEGQTYFVEITLSDGAGAEGFRRITCVAAYND